MRRGYKTNMGPGIRVLSALFVLIPACSLVLFYCKKGLEFSDTATHLWVVGSTILFILSAISIWLYPRHRAVLVFGIGLMLTSIVLMAMTGVELF